jgi:hypothetical protein
MIDVVLPSDGPGVSWNALYSAGNPDRWTEIANCCTELMRQCHTRDVFLTHEPATNPFYGGAALTDWAGLTAAYRKVNDTGARIWFDQPTLREPVAPDFADSPRFIESARYIRAIHKTQTPLQRNTPSRHQQWACAYYGTYEPLASDTSDWRRKAAGAHKAFVGENNFHSRPSALEFCQRSNGGPKPVLYVKHDDWGDVARRMKEALV